MAVVKALTLTQPWASLVAVGAKRYETRSWPTSYRGPLAIHAAKGLSPIGGKTGLRQIWHLQPTFRQALEAGGFSFPEQLPLGAIVATCELVDVLATGTLILGEDAIARGEEGFGDFAAGRFAWQLRNVKRLETPLPCGGQLGLWDFDGQLEVV